MRILLLCMLTFFLSCTPGEDKERMGFVSPYEERFSEYRVDLMSFSSKHNLLIEKYYHDAPSWSFCFTHPQGGQAKLDLSINDQGELSISSVWWLDDYSQFTRSLRWGESEKIENTETLTSILERRLNDVLAWNLNAWSQVADDYEDIWGRYSEAEFKAMTPDWPTVIQ